MFYDFILQGLDSKVDRKHPLQVDNPIPFPFWGGRLAFIRLRRPLISSFPLQLFLFQSHSPSTSFHLTHFSHLFLYFFLFDIFLSFFFGCFISPSQ